MALNNTWWRYGFSENDRRLPSLATAVLRVPDWDVCCASATPLRNQDTEEGVAATLRVARAALTFEITMRPTYSPLQQVNPSSAGFDASRYVYYQAEQDHIRAQAELQAANVALAQTQRADFQGTPRRLD